MNRSVPVLEAADLTGVIAANVYHEGKRLRQIDVGEAGNLAKQDGHVVWIGLHEPSPILLRQIQSQFNLHYLAVEDARKSHQHPKLERYGDVLFVVVRTVQMVSGSVEFGETHFFVGKGYVVSVRHGASTPYGPVRERCEAEPEQLSQGEDYILYAILDYIVDNYFPVVGQFLSEVEALEQVLLSSNAGAANIQRLYHLRRELLRLKRAVSPLLDVCARLQSADMFPIDKEMQPLFRDVTDHVRRLQEDVDSMREMLAFAFEANLLTAQSEQTIIARRLAAWAAILAVPTAIAGVYGMNFDHMPELRWAYGYYVVLGVIGIVCVSLFLLFRRYRWL